MQVYGETTEEDEMEQVKEKAARSSETGGVISSIAGTFYSHPILTAAVLCVMSMPIATGAVSVMKSLLICFYILLIGAAAAIYSAGISGQNKKLRSVIIISSSAAAAAFLFFYESFIKGSYSIVIMNGGIALCVGIFFYLYACNKLNTRNIILLLFAAGFIMRLSYILMMSAGMIQHDVYTIGAGAGHSGYIEYLYENGHLPDFDVRQVDQFYHPPLHHIIAAVWMRIQTMSGTEYAAAYENIQLLTLFYSSVCLILSYKIFRRAGLSGAALITATAIIALCPTFYILSGSINNDILSITFMLGAVLNTMYWYKSRNIGRIICIALCIGLGMMTKLSVWMVAPAVALVFIFVFFTSIKDWLKYLVQYSVFIIVCAPIALFWSVRNFLMWGVPFTFVQRLSEKSAQYVGDIPLLTRLFDFSPYQFADTAPQFVMYKGSYNEYNPLIGFFKTSMFDEGISVRRFSRLPGFSHILLFSAIALGIIAFAAMIVMFVRKNPKQDSVTKAFLGMIYFVILGMYYYFCIDYPHVCTMNVRYGVPLIVIGALSAGYLVGELINSKKKAALTAGGVICAVTGIYAVSGFVVFNICAESLLKL